MHAPSSPAAYLQAGVLLHVRQHGAVAPAVPQRGAAAAHQPARNHLRDGVVPQSHTQPGLHAPGGGRLVHRPPQAPG